MLAEKGTLGNLYLTWTCSTFLKEMSSAWDDDQLILALQLGLCLAVQINNSIVIASADEKGWRVNFCKSRACHLGAPTP